jgi:ABC-type transport system involved in multi-copper enzyme maturation permease subunit
MIDETRYTETPASSATLERSRLSASDTVNVEREFSDYLPRYVTWGPIWAGAAVAIGVHVLLSVLGMAVGLSVAAGTEVSGQGITISVGIWMIISALAALFVGGWIAGFLSSPRSPGHGAVHGFIMWCVVTALSAVLLTSTGSALASGGLSALGQNVRVNQPAFSDEFGLGTSPVQSNRTQINAEKATDTTAGVAWWTFAILLLSAGAAAVGGSVNHRPGVYDRFKKS